MGRKTYQEEKLETYGREGQETAGDGGRSLLRVLAAVAILLVLVLAAGSLWGLATGSRAKKLARAGEDLPAGARVFTGLGTIRASTGDKPPAVIVASPSFPYPASDRAFAEELESKKEAMRQAVKNWLSTKTAAELSPSFEAATKAGIRDAINGVLALGDVDTIWLSDFSVVQ